MVNFGLYPFGEKCSINTLSLVREREREKKGRIDRVDVWNPRKLILPNIGLTRKVDMDEHGRKEE